MHVPPTMMARLSVHLASVREAVERHGGGWRGLRSVVRRSLNLVRALGWRGFLQRLHGARDRIGVALQPDDAAMFAAPEPLERIDLDVGVMAHLFYPDLLEELAADLERMPVPFVLMVSVVDAAAQDPAMRRLERLPQVRALHVRVVPNRGRDWAPLLTAFRDEILVLDLVCHLHSKKSLYTGSEQSRWRRYLISSLLGSSERIAWILGTFQAMPNLGLVYPESFESVPLWAHTWLGNAEYAREWGARLGIEIDEAAYFDYPAGSMFWARVRALEPLYELGLEPEDFPEEGGQTDGTLQHTLERLAGLLPLRQGMRIGLLPADGSLALRAEGARNWDTYFRFPLKDKIAYAAVDATVVSVDLFDTLVLRPFLEPRGARAYLAHMALKTLGVEGFDALRARAETMARARAGHDVDTAAVYAALARLGGAGDLPIESLRALELQTEQRLLRPRAAAVEAVAAAAAAGKRIVALSDMYLNSAELARVLPATVAALPRNVYVSCETGWRKDTGTAWRQVPALEGVPPTRWLHLGDNEHSDVQRPQSLGFLHPVHVLRPSALLDTVPTLRGLRPQPQVRDRWQDQLWLGLLANHFTELADRHPGAFGHTLTLEAPESLGYVVLGPLLLDYCAWLGRTALDEGMRKLLFLSREGHLFKRVFDRLQAVSPSLASLDARYLLASRRGTGIPSLRRIEELSSLFGGSYNGPLDGLLRTRLGPRIADAARERLGKAACEAEVFLPEMRTEIVGHLQPLADVILRVAEEERTTYLAYWKLEAGDDAAMVADLGYAGTIQTQLARLSGRSLSGGYFALNRAADRTGLHGGWARARFHDARDTEERDEISPIVQNDLLLEAVLTAPDGQFCHFEPGAGRPRPVFLADSRPVGYASIARAHQGAEAFIRDVCAVTGDDTAELAFDRDLVQQPLRCLGSGRWRLGDWARGLRIDDHYTGRGVITAMPDVVVPR